MSHDPFDLDEVENDAAVAESAPPPDEVADLRWLMGSKRGRRVVWRLLERAGVFRSSFSPNAAQTAFNEGNRNVGLVYLDEIHQHCPELYAPMMKEQNTHDGE